MKGVVNQNKNYIRNLSLENDYFIGDIHLTKFFFREGFIQPCTWGGEGILTRSRMVDYYRKKNARRKS